MNYTYSRFFAKQHKLEEEREAELAKTYRDRVRKGMDYISEHRGNKTNDLSNL